MSPCGPEGGLELAGAVLHPGRGRGEVLVLDDPLSFWGGSDLVTGRIVDERHPQRGASMAGRVVAVASGRGSSSSSSVLAEQIRSGVAPAALLLAERDAILVLGALVAAELYAVRMPVLLLGPGEHARVPRTGTASVSAEGGTGTVRFSPAVPPPGPAR